MDIHAWKTALILRGCPPADILYGPVDEPLRAHLDVCPACRKHLDMNVKEREAWAAMGRALLPEPLPPPARKTPGQVWRVRRGLAGWGPKYRYCHPPLVLILDLPGDGLAQVAQIYPGDDFLTDDDIPLPGLGFAQPWNIYSLALTDLETFQGESREGVPRLLGRSRASFADLDEASPLFWFRTMELDLGAHFAGQSLAATVEGLKPEASLLPLSTMPLDALRHALQAKGQKISLGGDQPLLTLARYNREETTWGLAASGEHIRAVNFALLDDVGLEIRQASITFSTVHFADGILVLGGRINADFASTREVFAWWDAQERLVHAETADISADGLYFNLRFAGLSEREFHVGRLVALLSGRE